PSCRSQRSGRSFAARPAHETRPAMTSLSVLGSGSAGNAFALVSEGMVLLIDAGFSAREIARRAAVAGVDLTRLSGIALTHEHGDHAQGALRLAEQHDVPVLASAGTWAAL